MFRIFGYLFIVLGMAVFAYIPGTWLWGYFEQQGLRGDFEQESISSLSFNQNVLDQIQGAAEAEKLRQLAIAFKARLQDEQTIAQLEIPKIGVNVIIVEGTSDGALRKGPGHLEETPLPGMGGNFSVAGDRVLYGAHFLNLDEMENGDEIIARTPYGNFNYAVEDKFIITPDDVSVLQDVGHEVITLITCDPPWDISHRLIVRAKLVTATVKEG